ncbi:MAG: helix-turn-helix domain-containing protein [Gemmataceae bacterium]
MDEFLNSLAAGLQIDKPRCAVPEFGSPLPAAEPEYISVAEAQRRYLNGGMSRKWWYRIASAGKIAHHKVGDSILLRTDAIEALIAASRQERKPDDVKPSPVTPEPAVVPTPIQPRKKVTVEPSFFRLFSAGLTRGPAPFPTAPPASWPCLPACVRSVSRSSPRCFPSGRRES